MPIPTVTSISPNSGTPSGGQMVEVIGTDFRTPTAPDPTIIPVPVAPPSVRVYLNGVEVESVYISDTRLFIKIPATGMPIDSHGNTSGQLQVDLTIENIDDTGVLIPTETVTVEDAYTYNRPGISHVETDSLVALSGQLVDMLRAQVLANTNINSSTDYDPNTGTQVIEVECNPQLIIHGPSMMENTFYTRRKLPGLASGVTDEWFEYRRPRYVDLRYEIMGTTNSTVQLINLMQLLTTVLDRNATFNFVCDPANPTATEPLELHISRDCRMEKVQMHGKSDLRVFTAEIIIKGLPLLTLPGADNDGIIGVTHTVTEEPKLDSAFQIGEDNPAAQGASIASPG